MVKHRTIVAAVVVLLSTAGFAQDWDTVPYIEHSAYQAVNDDGTSAYPSPGGFPIRMVGVVLNNTEDWLDPTPAYDLGVHLWQMGGEAEFYAQAVDLDGTGWDPFPGSAFDDFGGTACWMGQNYGNVSWLLDPSFSYTDDEWTAELGRLNLFGGDGVTDPIRAGDLVEIRARAGMNYKGKMNVNEHHSKDPAKDFEIVRLVAGFGLPTPTQLALSDLKDAADTFIFDSTRQTGGERHQSTLVNLRNVWVTSSQSWTTDSDIAVTDGVRTFTVHLGLNPGFDGTELFGVDEAFNVIGILDQSSFSGIDGYQLLAMNAADFVPEPAPGDADLDGDVDDVDLALLLSGWGQSGQGWGDGDFTGEGDVTDIDLALLLNNWGFGVPIEVVPEPATMALLAIGACLPLLRRRR